MKNRKTIIVAFLLVAALCLGIGYAALTDTLNINGTANISKGAAETEFDEDVYFTSASGNGCSAAIADGNKPDAATLTITDGMGVLGDYVTATYTVQNEGEKPVTVSIAHNSSTNFDISTGSANYTIPAKSSIDIDVTVTLKTTVTATITNETFSLVLNATSAG